MSEDYFVTVCSACRRASCWHYEFPCTKFSMAGTVDVLASTLKQENREHASWFSRERILQVCGNVREKT